MIDERSTFATEKLRFKKPVSGVRCFESNELDFGDDGYELPATKGRLLLEAPDYFA